MSITFKKRRDFLLGSALLYYIDIVTLSHVVPDCKLVHENVFFFEAKMILIVLSEIE